MVAVAVAVAVVVAEPGSFYEMSCGKQSPEVIFGVDAGIIDLFVYLSISPSFYLSTYLFTYLST